MLKQIMTLAVFADSSWIMKFQGLLEKGQSTQKVLHQSFLPGLVSSSKLLVALHAMLRPK